MGKRELINENVASTGLGAGVGNPSCLALNVSDQDLGWIRQFMSLNKGFVHVASDFEDAKQHLRTLQVHMLLMSGDVLQKDELKEIIDLVNPEVTKIVYLGAVSELTLLEGFQLGITDHIPTLKTDEGKTRLNMVIKDWIDTLSKVAQSERPVIVFVEDEEIDQLLIRRNFISRHPNYKCFIASAVKELTPLLTSHAVRLIVTDHQLGDGDGLEVLKLATRHSIPSIVLTSKGSPELVTEFFEQGAEDYMIKDQVQGDHLLYLSAKVRNVLRKHHTLYELQNSNLELEKMTDELSKACKDLEDFSFITSHNLKAPLSNIMGLVDVLSKSGSVQQSGQEFLNAIYSCTARLTGILDDMSGIIAVRNSEVEFEQVNLSETVSTVLDSLAILINHAGVQIDVQVDPTDRCYCQRQDLEQVLQILIENSIKYRKPEGPCEIQIRSKVGREQASVEVIDNGIGIDLEIQGDKIFGLYQRFNDEIEGQGIGLYLAKLLMEKNQGAISVTSKPHKGTTFTLNFKQQIP